MKREPIKVTARRIGVTPESAIRLVKTGALYGGRNRSGRYWSTAEAAERFDQGESQTPISPDELGAAAVRRMKEALR